MPDDNDSDHFVTHPMPNLSSEPIKFVPLTLLEKIGVVLGIARYIFGIYETA